MSKTSTDTKPQGQPGLFGEEPASSAEAQQPRSLAAQPGAPRLLHAVRDQVELRAWELDASLAPDHPARSVWAFVQSLDLAPLYAPIKCVQGRAGAPAIDPAILMALWLWATIDGVGSARELERLCERDDAYRWVCGGVGVNHHTLADFRTAHAAWLDEQLTRSIASLMERRLVTLQVVAQDGMRVRAAAKASSMRRKERVKQLHALAREQVRTLQAELDADAGASSRRKQAARERAARERAERLEQALRTFDDIERSARDSAEDKARERAARAARTARRKANKARAKARAKREEAKAEEAKVEQAKPEQATSEQATGKQAKRQDKKPPRVSTTDPEARVMKMADGGFRAAFNVQLAVDEATQLIAGLEVVNAGSDMNEMQPMHAQLVQRYGHMPEHWLADGGYPKYAALEALGNQGTQPVVPPARSRKADFDPLAPKRSDTPLLARWRALMASAEGQALYRRRAASVECANAQLRRRGLYAFNVRGKLKARAVVLWHALAHNLMRMRSLGIAFAG